MSNPEFENSQQYLGEVDWSENGEVVKDFPFKTKNILKLWKYESLPYYGIQLRDLYHEYFIEDLYKRFNGFDFTSMRSSLFETAVSETFILPDTNNLTTQRENIALYQYASDLRSHEDLESIRVNRGNLADYVAVFWWFAYQRKYPQGIDYSFRTSDISFAQNSGELLVKYEGFRYGRASEKPYPIIKFGVIQAGANSEEVALAPLVFRA